jgi:DNA-binding GntR family transcriptional regulator
MQPNSSMEDYVYNRLKTALIKRYIRQGCQLVETAIANQLDVSRTPVRAAIKRLNYEGYVRFIINKGAFVVKPGAAEIREAFAVRIPLEKMAVGLAARLISNKELKSLRRQMEKEISIFEQRKIVDDYKINDNIHFTIAKASGNKFLHHYIKDIINRTTIYLVLADPVEKMEINPSIEEHLLIIRALEDRDPAAAEKTMVAHLKSNLDTLNLESILPKDYISL